VGARSLIAAVPAVRPASSVRKAVPAVQVDLVAPAGPQVAVPCTRLAARLPVALRERAQAWEHVPASALRGPVSVPRAQEWAELPDWFRLPVRPHVRSVRVVPRAVAVSITKRAKKAR